MMTETALMSTEAQAALIEQVVMVGDLSKLSPRQRLDYYRAVCQSAGLNPLTKPFDYLTLNGKMVLYANKTCTDQLRAVHKITIAIVARELIEDVYVVTGRGTLPDGRSDESTGAVSVAEIKGDAKANAMMKAETKCKRRLTLSLSGLGMLDETEVETIPNAQRMQVDMETGEILEAPPASKRPASPKAPPHPLVQAGFSKKSVALIAAWMGAGHAPDEWTDAQKQTAQQVTGVLLEGVHAGIAVAELAEIVEAYAHREHATWEDAEALIAQVRTMTQQAIDEGPDAVEVAQ